MIIHSILKLLVWEALLLVLAQHFQPVRVVIGLSPVFALPRLQLSFAALHVLREGMDVVVDLDQELLIVMLVLLVTLVMGRVPKLNVLLASMQLVRN